MAEGFWDSWNSVGDSYARQRLQRAQAQEMETQQNAQGMLGAALSGSDYQAPQTPIQKLGALFSGGGGGPTPAGGGVAPASPASTQGPMQPGQSGTYDLGDLVQRLKARGATPQQMVAALNQAYPLMNAQSQIAYRQSRLGLQAQAEKDLNQYRGANLGLRRDQLDETRGYHQTEAQQRAVDEQGRNSRFQQGQAGINDRFSQREQRIKQEYAQTFGRLKDQFRQTNDLAKKRLIAQQLETARKTYYGALDSEARLASAGVMGPQRDEVYGRAKAAKEEAQQYSDTLLSGDDPGEFASTDTDTEDGLPAEMGDTETDGNMAGGQAPMPSTQQAPQQRPPISFAPQPQQRQAAPPTGVPQQPALGQAPAAKNWLDMGGTGGQLKPLPPEGIADVKNALSQNYSKPALFGILKQKGYDTSGL